MTMNILLIEDETRIRHKLKKELNHQLQMHIVGSANNLSRAYELIKEKECHILIIEAHFILDENRQFIHKLLNLKPLLVIAIANPDEREALLLLRNTLPIHHIILKNPEHNNYEEDRLMAALQGYQHKEGQLYKIYRQKQSDMIVQKGEMIIAMGASTGGVQAIESVLSRLDGNLPPILMVQHISKAFSNKMADRICKNSNMMVKEAEHGDILQKNVAYLAPGDQHMTIKSVKNHYEICLDYGPLVHFQRPAVENLFDSVAKVVGDKGVGVLLTGMGADGAEGLLAMKEAGAYTMAQDAKSSVIFGMPKAAIELGGACEVVHLEHVPKRIHELSHVQSKGHRLKRSG